MFHEKESLSRIIIEIFPIIIFIYPMSTLVLFGLLCSIVSNQLRTITKLVKKIPTNGINQLKKLQIEHARVCASIDLINRSFGLILLLEVSYIFIGATVNFVCYMVVSLSGRGWTMYFLISCVIFTHIINLLLVSFSAETITHQVLNS